MDGGVGDHPLEQGAVHCEVLSQSLLGQNFVDAEEMFRSLKKTHSLPLGRSCEQSILAFASQFL